MARKTFEELCRELPRSEAIRLVMADQALDAARADEFLAIILGEVEPGPVMLEPGQEPDW